MLALATERKDHVLTRPQDFACGDGSRDLGVPAHRLSEWRDHFLAGAENAL